MREYNPHELNWGYYDDDGNYNPPSRPYKNGCSPPKSDCSCESKDKTSAEIDKLKTLVSELKYKVEELARKSNEEQEDYEEEPKVGYIIDPMEEDCISADDSGYEDSDVERAKELGLWFETEEEAEKAAEKLKAWKRLKDKGMSLELDSFRSCIDYRIDLTPLKDEDIGNIAEDLDLLFRKEK